MVWVLHYHFFGLTDVEFSKTKENFTKDISKYENYIKCFANENKLLEMNELVQEFYSRKDDMYEGFFHSVGEEFISLSLNNKISMKEI